MSTNFQTRTMIRKFISFPHHQFFMPMYNPAEILKSGAMLHMDWDYLIELSTINGKPKLDESDFGYAEEPFGINGKTLRRSEDGHYLETITLMENIEEWFLWYVRFYYHKVIRDSEYESDQEYNQNRIRWWREHIKWLGSLPMAPHVKYNMLCLGWSWEENVKILGK